MISKNAPIDNIELKIVLVQWVINGFSWKAAELTVWRKSSENFSRALISICVWVGSYLADQIIDNRACGVLSLTSRWLFQQRTEATDPLAVRCAVRISSLLDTHVLEQTEVLSEIRSRAGDCQIRKCYLDLMFDTGHDKVQRLFFVVGLDAPNVVRLIIARKNGFPY